MNAAAGTILSVEGIWKRFARGGGGAPTLKQLVLRPRASLRREFFWALQDISLRIHHGDTVGLIGANGSGKSTLLRLLAGVGKPTRGVILRRRAITAMMTLGESFDPLLSGRENAMTAGILAGYTRRQARDKLGEIVEFSELEDFFDEPVRTYSDGMRMRLAFAVSSTVAPEILLIDEVLSVGDLRFQEKCLTRLDELQRAGTTILLASHDEAQISELCSRVLWLVHGRIHAEGAPEEIYERYRDTMRAETERRVVGAATGPVERSGRDERFGTQEIVVEKVRLAPNRVGAARVHEGVPVMVEVDLLPNAPVDDPIVSVSVRRVADGVMVIDVNTAADGVRLGRVDRPTSVALRLDRIDVEPGSYHLDVGVYERDWAYVYDYRRHVQALTVHGSGKGFGPSRRWELV
ncbi:MAG TPA: ABC transporter ATP-binding protein [Gaiellaceae bacterium]|nr:ABC transporter ATP-binding protein [Gaiellaceae bacterium]